MLASCLGQRGEPRPIGGLGRAYGLRLKGQRPFGVADEHGQPPELGEGERDVVRELEPVGDSQGLIKLAEACLPDR